ncbi:DUF2971 domain-containing protein [Pseudomonas fragariae (ex Marin et al. 2024)]|uniref:DUF2971 domain-containing protein n=2 Tax=Pseudomonas TaxID=286 RepID=A0A650D7D5_PSESF|nr:MULTISPECIES: DUF2971 domain-containing protein [Pseudomonas]MDU8421934.1 DUF2971 domain-containing protein [Pseudomonas syringae]MDU8607165.1 DUF2971 domain-containing protein [Pseudomonas syringae group sp. 247E2]MDU8619380.1 DUF2971 domain-containing protein [Pseudomonas syringae]MDU8629108.1 DUF2971 domain-containing protein [Pseudomonas syringae group sp. 243L2]MEE4093129.1 DUF2971 domain-containing protein [Pseudomonas viridiflava]
MGKAPASLYKYLSFSDRMVEQLYHGKVFYADPGTFNDPLDCRPVVIAGNQSIERLKLLLKLMVIRRVEKESSAALKRLKLKGQRLDLHRARLGETEVQDAIRGIEYMATDPEITDQAGYYQRELLTLIQSEVKDTLATGVLCLSANATSPLMWSHYGQQHRGVCIEYDTSDLKSTRIHKVVYGQSREILADAILRWLQDGDVQSQLEVERASLLTKSGEWRYEKEWRLLAPIGLDRSPFPVKSVTFGMNCPSAIFESTMSMLGGEKSTIKFWKITEPTSNFKLKRARIHFDDSMRPMLDQDYSWLLDDLDDAHDV